MRFVVERLGGVVGFGVGHLKSRGEVEDTDLSPADRRQLASLFAGPKRSAEPNQSIEERYRITKVTPSGSKSITLPFRDTPSLLRDSVRDTLD